MTMHPHNLPNELTAIDALVIAALAIVFGAVCWQVIRWIWRVN